jgi:hypothetical protein
MEANPSSANEGRAKENRLTKEKMKSFMMKFLSHFN